MSSRLLFEPAAPTTTCNLAGGFDRCPRERGARLVSPVRWASFLTTDVDGSCRCAIVTSVAALPQDLRYLFWESDFEKLDPDRDANSILPRVLELGRLRDIQWMLRFYGTDRIRTFLRTVGHPELTERTLGFWRAVLDEEEETWESPPAWRKSSSAPWID